MTIPAVLTSTMASHHDDRDEDGDDDGDNDGDKKDDDRGKDSCVFCAHSWQEVSAKRQEPR